MIQSLLNVVQQTDWNAKMCPKKSADKSLTRIVNKCQDKNVKRPENQSVNKSVSLYIGVKFANCDLWQMIFLHNNVCAIIVCYRKLSTLFFILIFHTYGDLKHQNIF